MVDKYTTNKDIDMNRQQAVEQARQASLKSWAQAQRQAMHESTRNTPVNQAPAAAAGASGTGSGGDEGIALFYAYGTPFDGATTPGIFQKIYSTGNVSRIGEQTFTGPTVLCRNTDDGNMYYISQDDSEGEMVIGTVSVETGVQTALDRSILTALNYSPPSSLVYTGNNTFVYLADSYFYTNPAPETQEIIQIQIVDGEVTVTSLSEYDVTEIGLAGVFQWDGEWWALQIASFGLAGVYNIDIETGVVETFGGLELINYPFSEMYKFTAWGLSQAPGGKIYVAGVVTEKDNDYERLIIAEMDPANYTASYVQAINIFSGDPYIPVDIEII